MFLVFLGGVPGFLGDVPDFFGLFRVFRECSRFFGCSGMFRDQSGAFPLLEMFWSADQNKQLSNQSVNLVSREVRPIKLLIVCRHYLTVD